MLKCASAARVGAILLCVGMSGWLRAADTAPAPADYSEPKQAMKTFLRAQDKAALMDALVVAPADQTDVDAFVDVMDATTKLQKAAQAEFGFGAAKYFSDVTKAELDAKLKSIDAAEVTVNGDSAKVLLPADEAAKQASSTVQLKKVGSDWKIDAASLFGISNAPKAATAKRVEIANKVSGITNQMISDIKARKFTSASDAYQEYWNRSRVAVNAMAATAPASAGPATRP